MVKDSHTGKVGGHVVSSAAYVYYYVNSHVVISVESRKQVSSFTDGVVHSVFMY